MANQVRSGGTQLRQIPSVDKAKAPTLRTIGDIFDAAYQAWAFDPPIGSGSGGGVFNYTAGLGLYGDNNANTVGANSIQIGNNAATALTESIAIGRNAAATGTGPAIAIGFNARARGTANIVMGNNAFTYSTQANNVVIGNNAYTNYNALNASNVVIGHNAYTYYTAYRSVSIGYQAHAGSYGVAILGATDGATQQVIIGNQASAIGDRGVAVGAAASALTNGIAIGYNAAQAAGATYSVTIGYNASTPAGYAYSVVIGNAVVAPAASTVTFGVSATDRITFDAFAGVAQVAAASTHSLAVLIGGTRYYLLMTNVAP